MKIHSFWLKRKIPCVRIANRSSQPYSCRRCVNRHQRCEIAHLCSKEVTLSSRMTKRINLPANPRNLVELLLNIPVPQRCLIDDIDVQCGCLVVHAPAAIAAGRHKEKTAIRAKTTNRFTSMSTPLQQAEKRLLPFQRIRYLVIIMHGLNLKKKC